MQLLALIKENNASENYGRNDIEYDDFITWFKI